MLRTLPIVLLVVPALLAPAAAQTIHKVPQEHATIQLAVDATANGDTIQISGGTYPEAVVVTGKQNLVIQAKGKVVIEPPTGVGLLLTGCTDCRVERIRVSGGDSHGIQLIDTNDTVLSKCRVEDSALDGIRVEGGGNVTIEKCTVKSTGNDGVALTESAGSFAHDVLVDHCLLSLMTDDAVDIEGDHNTVDHCQILKPFNNGANVGPAASAHDNLLTDCKLIHVGNNGVIIDGDDNTVRNCKLVQPFDRGVLVNGGANVAIEDSKFTKSGDDSVRVETAATDVTVSGCKISKSADDGIEMDGPNCIVEGNTISGCDDDGIEVDGLDGAYTGNKCNGNKDDGFVLSEGTGNTLSANKAHGNKGFDLDDVIGDQNTVDGTNSFGTTFP